MSIVRKTKVIHVCDFCGRDEHEVAYIVAGEGVDICDECVDVAAEIVREERAKAAKAQGGDAS
ncbi:hypothetical protein BUE93_20850 [Chromobacterium amazonense]|uniref:ClpX-type ZB domain-containing protein n=1 Tax=Chromobacterium amazonense TaxID=1382803 RepID=A0A2S9WZ15_9NEIS|nr:ClpX C4-type zinc finger protein [Chromobacterium amazonense]PRP68717.1 hypothetical protein BUE93_20850 [Chromobacterium amazonense]